MTPDDAIDDLARAVLDGEPVDWTQAESASGGASGPVKHLKVVAAIASAQRMDLSANAEEFSAARGHAPFEMWGHLRLVERIGRGAFGEVYRAWDTRLEREVALKLVPADARGDGAASSMLREGRLLARVRHPNVVTIHGADQMDGYVGLWMELVHGRTLEEILREGQTFKPAEVTRIGIDLAHALETVHAAGVIHRDIKAQNVMREDDGRIVLMDFGTGRSLDEQGSDLAGTPLYLAPEIFRGGPATAQTDVYSLGVLLYRLLTGSLPVQGTTIREVRAAHEVGRRVEIHAARPDVPRLLARVIDRAIDPRSEERYATAEAMAAELELAAQSPTRHWWWAGAAAAVAVLLAVLVWLVPERPVIGILPFENHVSEPGDDVLSDGLTIELNRRLAQVQGLGVRSAVSSLAYKGKARDLKAFGRELGVNHVLEGSVFGEAGTIRRINASLVRVADEETIWAGSFVPDNNDVFSVQEQIALAIVSKLRLRFAAGERSHQTDPGLQYLFYRAQALRARRDTESRERAAFLFDQISQADPSYVPAVAGLARALLTISGDRGVEPPLDPRAEPSAINAHRNDPLWPEANAAMGLLCAQKRDWGCARRYFEEAIRLDPSMTTTHADFVLSTLLPLGRVTEALRLIEDARIEDPMSLDVRRTLAHLQVENGLYDLAIETAKDVMAEDADLRFVEQWLGRALYLSGRPQEALAIFQTRQGPYRAYALAIMDRRDEAEALLASWSRVDARHMLVYAGLGDRDRAFDALERAAALDPWRAVTWMQRPEMKPLRSDPRFDMIRERLLQPRPLSAVGAGAIANAASTPPARSAPSSAGER